MFYFFLELNYFGTNNFRHSVQKLTSKSSECFLPGNDVDDNVEDELDDDMVNFMQIKSVTI